MTDIYTIQLNSINVAVAGTVRNDLNYPFDWTILPQGRYEVKFNFLSESVPYWGSGSLPHVYVGLNQNNSLTTPSSWGAVPTQLLGVLYPYENLGNGVNFFAGHLDNTPNILESLPTGNLINVKIRNKFNNFWAGNYISSGYTADMPANSQVLTISGSRLTGFPLIVGSVIIISTKTFTIESFISVNPTTGLGTYTTTTANNAIIISAASVSTQNILIGEYTMTLQLKRIE